MPLTPEPGSSNRAPASEISASDEAGTRPESTWDVIVVGAGAAGFMAAEQCARRGCRTVLIEKNRKPGVKILMSGGTRCNLTQATDVAGILREFGDQGRFLRSAVHDFGPDDLVRYFADAGVPTKIEETGKIFPTSDRALDVQRALWRQAMQAGVQLVLGQGVTALRHDDSNWRVETTAGFYHGRRLILTTGGCSYPGCGTRGDAYAWLEQLGHAIVTPRPALVPLTIDDAWLRELSGMTLPDVVIRVVPTEALRVGNDLAELLAVVRRRSLQERRSSLLLTHFGLSGPAAMDVSRRVTQAGDVSTVQLVCDFLPDVTLEMLQASLAQSADRQGGQTVLRFLGERLPQRLAVRLAEQAGLDPQGRLAELSKSHRRQLLREIKALPVKVTGSRGFAKAEVTAGGVSRAEIDPRTMASRRVSNLWVAGELLDVDGPIGGYNFQAAFSTGRLAGISAASSARGRGVERLAKGGAPSSGLRPPSPALGRRDRLPSWGEGTGSRVGEKGRAAALGRRDGLPRWGEGTGSRVGEKGQAPELGRRHGLPRWGEGTGDMRCHLSRVYRTEIVAEAGSDLRIAWPPLVDPSPRAESPENETIWGPRRFHLRKW